MKNLQAELELAETELAFWQDFASWWVETKGRECSHRIKEAIDRAEARYLATKMLLDEQIFPDQEITIQ